MTGARRALLLLGFVALGAVAGGPAAGQTTEGRRVFLIRVNPASFEDLMAVPEIAGLARAGGAALLSYGGAIAPHVGGARSPGVDDEMEYVVSSRSQLDAVGAVIEDRVRRYGAQRVLVVVLSLERTASMEASKDELFPVVVAEGTPRGIFRRDGPMGTLMSDTTRSVGVVTDADVLATVAAFLGEPGPEQGEPIRPVDAPPPFELHERYLAQRRMYVPIGTAAGLYVTAVGLFAVAALAWPRRFPGRARRAIGWACLSVPALAVGLLAAGHLPDLTYATVVPFVAIVAALGTMAFSPLARRDVPLVPAGIGAGVLAAFLAEALLGWTAALTPFLGGSQLDGVRFYGLPNAFVGLLVGASVFVAHRLRTLPGCLLIAAVALLAGLPYAGANLGGSVALFAAAGLWLAVRERARLGAWTGLALAAGVVTVGTAAVLVAHALSPLPTHVTRFEETVGGLAGIWGTFVDRLGVGLDLIRRNPAAVVPVLGLPVVVFVVLRPPAPLRGALERWPAWRDATLVTLLAGVVAYLANDSGPAAAGLAFGLALGGLLGVSLLAGPGKIQGP